MPGLDLAVAVGIADVDAVVSRACEKNRSRDSHDDHVVAGTAEDALVTKERAALCAVAFWAADDQIIAVAAPQVILSGAAVQTVAALTAVDVVVPSESTNHVGARSADQGVVTAGAMDRLRK
jgi:hypothetical protein